MAVDAPRRSHPLGWPSDRLAKRRRPHQLPPGRAGLVRVRGKWAAVWAAMPREKQPVISIFPLNVLACGLVRTRSPAEACGPHAEIHAGLSQFCCSCAACRFLSFFNRNIKQHLNTDHESFASFEKIWDGRIRTCPSISWINREGGQSTWQPLQLYVSRAAKSTTIA